MHIRFTTQCPFVSLNGIPHWIRIWQEADSSRYAIGGYRGTDSAPHPDLIFVAGLATYEAAAAKWSHGFNVPAPLVALAKALISSGEAAESA